MKNLLVLVLVVCCSCSFSFDTWGQMLDEGTTVTTEIEQQGNVETVTETTVTIENKTTGDVLDSDNGIVAASKDGNANTDWGGAGSIYSHSSCTDAASGFPATGTDGRTSGCGHARSNSLTTWRQYVDLNSFDIKSGGKVDYEFLFAFPDSMYQNEGQTAYVQTKGYNDNVLQWETGLVTIDKTTFTQNPNNYTNNTNWVNTVNGAYDFANQLDKVYIEIGGYGEYYWDEFQYNVAYNHITTVVDTWMQVVAQQELDNTINTIIDDPITSTPVTQTPDIIDVDILDINIAPIDTPIDQPTDTGMGTITPVTPEITVDVVTGNTIDDTVADIEILVAEIEEIGSTTAVETPQPVVKIETPTEEPTVNEVQPEAPTEETTESEPVKEVVVEQSEPKPEPVEEKQEVAEEPQQEEVEEKQVVEEVKEEKQVEETKEETKEEIVEDKPEEKKEVAQNDVKEKEPVQKTAKQEKQEKQQEQKQAKANEILNNLVDPYSNVAQMTTLALVNALGPNIKTYSAPVQTQPTWYESEEIYADAILQDPLGNFFGVRDSLTFNKMIDMQYE